MQKHEQVWEKNLKYEIMASTFKIGCGFKAAMLQVALGDSAWMATNPMLLS